MESVSKQNQHAAFDPSMSGGLGGGHLGIAMPTFTPLGSGLGVSDLGGSADNSLFGTGGLGDNQNTLSAP